MLEFIDSIGSTSTFTLVVAVFFATSVWWFLREIAGMPGLAWLSAPCIVVGAIAANFIAIKMSVPITGDRNTSVAIASAVGVIVALFMVFLATWLWMQMSDFRTRRRKERMFGPRSIPKTMQSIPADRDIV